MGIDDIMDHGEVSGFGKSGFDPSGSLMEPSPASFGNSLHSNLLSSYHHSHQQLPRMGSQTYQSAADLVHHSSIYTSTFQTNHPSSSHSISHLISNDRTETLHGHLPFTGSEGLSTASQVSKYSKSQGFDAVELGRQRGDVTHYGHVAMLSQSGNEHTQFPSNSPQPVSISSPGEKEGTHARTRKTKDQIEALERAFVGNRYPTRKEKEDLGHQIGLTYIQVHGWFDRKRQRNADGKRGVSCSGAKKTKEQVDALEAVFVVEKNPDQEDKENIARLFGLTYKQVYDWFYRKRQRAKDRQSEPSEPLASPVVVEEITVKRQKPSFNDQQKNALNAAFAVFSYPDRSDKEDLARLLGLTFQQVRGWFKQKRRKTKDAEERQHKDKTMSRPEKKAKPVEKKQQKSKAEAANGMDGDRGKDAAKTVFTEQQREALESVFSHDRYPTRREKEDLAARLGLTYKQIFKWFDHRRQRAVKSSMDLNHLTVAKKDSTHDSQSNNSSSPTLCSGLSHSQPVPQYQTAVSHAMGQSHMQHIRQMQQPPQQLSHSPYTQQSTHSSSKHPGQQHSSQQLSHQSPLTHTLPQHHNQQFLQLQQQRPQQQLQQQHHAQQHTQSHQTKLPHQQQYPPPPQQSQQISLQQVPSLSQISSHSHSQSFQHDGDLSVDRHSGLFPSLNSTSEKLDLSEAHSVLERVFFSTPQPGRPLKEELASRLNLPYNSVTQWFSDRRKQEREFEKKSTDMMSEADISDHQKDALEAAFVCDPDPALMLKEILAHSLGLTYTQVNNWFEERRRTKRRKIE